MSTDQANAPPRSLYDLFRRVVAANPDKVAFRVRREGRWHAITWAEQRDAVAEITRALRALGVERGDRVAILASTRLEWVRCDSGIVNGGGVTVGIYHSSLAADCGHILTHSGARLAFVEDESQLAKIQAVRDRAPALRHVVVFDAPATLPEGVLDWDSFLRRGADVADEETERIGRALAADDLCSLVYTSGTTGEPKGAMISHGNMLFTVGSATGCLTIEPHYATLLFLPLAHIFARMIVYLCLDRALVICFGEGLGRIAEEIREVRPEFLLSVPRIFEKIHQKILNDVERGPALKRRLFHWALGVALRATRLEIARRPVPPWLALRRALADRLVLGKIRGALGGRIAWAASGGAPLGPEICEFFLACGIPILEGLGMTENTSLSNVNRLGRIKPGTVGPVAPGIEMKIAEDGEVLFRGGNVMQGYYDNPEATAEVIDADGWLHSGDIGEVDEDGSLRITDRKKDLIVTAGGKNIAPQRVEQLLGTSRYISQIVAFGDRRPYLTALVTLQPDAMREWAARNGVASSPEQWATDPRVRELVRAEIRERNEQLASFETVKDFRILPHELSVDGGELTATLKIRRKVVYSKHATLLDEMYRDAAPHVARP